ncbi:MAG: S41 family peptidase, partial [Burkholderiaceae bacterium]
GLTLPEAVKLMRGKPRTSITLIVARKGEDKPLEFKLVRDVIRVQSVKSKMIEPGFGFIRVSQFKEKTVDDLVKHVNDLYKQGPLKGLVLDIRNDPGGLLHSAVGVTAAFLPAKALVVSTDGRTDDARRKFVASPEDYLRGRGEDILSKLPPQAKTVPLIVLVNGASASASEIVAGALQDHKRAVVLGTQTFGKGSVQTIIPLRVDGDQPAAIKLTTARYYTPKGRSIQAKGIVPDFIVEDTPEGNFAGFNVREADLVRHLENAKVEDATRAATVPGASSAPRGTAVPSATPVKPIDGKSVSPKRYDWGAPEDYQLSQAINHLKGKPVEIAKPKPDSVATAPGR